MYPMNPDPSEGLTPDTAPTRPVRSPPRRVRSPGRIPAVSGGFPRTEPFRPDPLDFVECTMDETTRKNAAQALQRALDRRDNGGEHR